MFCSKCGAEIDDNAVICVKCGRLVNENLVKKHESFKTRNDEVCPNGVFWPMFIFYLIGVLLEFFVIFEFILCLIFPYLAVEIGGNPALLAMIIGMRVISILCCIPAIVLSIITLCKGWKYYGDGYRKFHPVVILVLSSIALILAII